MTLVSTVDDLPSVTCSFYFCIYCRPTVRKSPCASRDLWNRLFCGNMGLREQVMGLREQVIGLREQVLGSGLGLV